jgi:hypothetical protein
MLRFLFVFSAILVSKLSSAQVSQKIPLSNSEAYISINPGNRTIADILTELNLKYGYDFYYVEDEIDLQKEVSLKLDSVILKKALETLFANSGVSFFVFGKQIVLKKGTVFTEFPPNKDSVNSGNINDSLMVDKLGLVKDSNNILLKKESLKLQKIPLRNNNKEHRSLFPNPNKIDSSVFVIDSLDSDTAKFLNKEEKVILDKKTKNNLIKKKTKGSSSFALGLFFTPEYSYRKLTGEPEHFINSRDSIESGRYTYSYGMFAEYALPVSIFIRTGISYSSYRESGKYYVKDDSIPNDPFGPPNIHENDTVINYKNSYNYLNIPISIGYRVGRKFNASICPGVNLNFLIDHKTNYPSFNSSPAYPAMPFPHPQYSEPRFNYYRSYLDPRNHSYRKFALSFSLKMEFAYTIRKSVKLFLAPDFHYFLTSIYSPSDDLKQKPYSIGVAIGTIFVFSEKNKK